MSDRRPRHHRRDAGLTLPELLITVTILGLVVTVLSMSIIATLRQADSTEGRINVAADEQRLGFDLPNDLASAATVDTDPRLSPCHVYVGPPVTCPSNVVLDGTSAALLTWVTKRVAPDGLSVQDVLTNVSYYFAPSAKYPGRFELRRIECTSVNGGAFECEVRVILKDLDGPPGGGTFVPGDTVPTWVIQVSEPLAPDAVSDDQLADAATRKDANRVVVTIDGGGSSAGGGGGVNQVSITAGGTFRRTIPADSTVNAPTFAQARSKCGGPVTLIVDNSGSLKYDQEGDENSDQVLAIENGVKAFINAFAGTPTQLQIVRFSSRSDVLEGAATDAEQLWTKYYDLTDPVQVQALTDLVDPAITASGGTNWEDGWFRTFYEPNGTLKQVIPEMTVFFTDGEPTIERLYTRATPGEIIPDSPAAPEPGWTKYDSDGNVNQETGTFWSTGQQYSQVAFNRADWVVDQVRGSTRIIGIGVGGIEWRSSNWVSNPGARYDYIGYERGSRRYQRVSYTYEVADYDYQQYRFGRWRDISKSTYDANNTTPDSSDGYRKVLDGWNWTDAATYNANNTTSDESDGYRRTASWSWIPGSEYTQFNTTGDDTDGYRDGGKQWVTRDSDALDWEYDPTATADAGGYRPRKVFSSAGAYAETPVSESTDNEVILSRLVAGNDNAVRAAWSADGTAVTNAAVAEMYILPRWDAFATALHAVAMSECGGTVTVSTRVNDAGRAPDPFTFQNATISKKDQSGVWQDQQIEPSQVTTTLASPSRTFDFDMTDGFARQVVIMPYDLSDLTAAGYAPAATPWTCRSGVNPIASGDVTTVPIADSPWTGIRLTIRPNTAVSCILNVTK